MLYHKVLQHDTVDSDRSGFGRCWSTTSNLSSFPVFCKNPCDSPMVTSNESLEVYKMFSWIEDMVMKKFYNIT
jgi:hypothetical protein